MGLEWLFSPIAKALMPLTGITAVSAYYMDGAH